MQTQGDFKLKPIVLALGGFVIFLAGCLLGILILTTVQLPAVVLPNQHARMVIGNLLPNLQETPRFWIPVSGVGEGIAQEVGSLSHTGPDAHALDYVWREYEGIDVYPVLRRQVVYSGCVDDYGCTVVVRHYDDWRWNQKYYSLYAHLQDRDLPSLWVDVDGSRPIGHMGRTGRGSNGIIHLHFAVRSSNNVYDGLTALYGKDSQNNILTPAFDVRPYMW